VRENLLTLYAILPKVPLRQFVFTVRSRATPLSHDEIASMPGVVSFALSELQHLARRNEQIDG
jgi:hypothetical protein